MLRFNFNFLNNIEPNLTTYLDIAQECMATDPHNTMAKSRACLEHICKDIVLNHDKVSKKHKQDSDKNPGLGKYTDILADCKALDKKTKSAFDVVRAVCNNAVHSLEADSEWAKLCLIHVHIFCKWYAKEYYNIEDNKEVTIVEYKGDLQKYSAPVTHEQAKAAYLNLNMNISNKDEALIVLASANLLNAYVKQKDALILDKSKYIFKKILVSKLEEIIKNKIEGVEIYFNKELTYVKVYDLQFSFHYLGASEFMLKYMKSNLNKPQKWSGIRLQPCAGIVFDRAMEYMQ